MKKWLPWIIVALFAFWAAGSLRNKSEPGFHIAEFGRLPVLLNGRVQPWDSVARNSLRQMRNKSRVVEVKDESAPWWKASERYEKLGATDWLLEVLAQPGVADERHVFRVDNDEVKSTLKLPGDAKHFSYSQIEPQMDELTRQAQRIDKIEAANRAAWESQMYKLYHAVMTYHRLKATLWPPTAGDPVAELQAYRQAMGPGMSAIQARDAGQSYDTNAFNTLIGFLGNYERASRFGYALAIPAETAVHSRDDWKNMGEALMGGLHGQDLAPAVERYATMVSAVRADDPATFNQAVSGYRQWLAQSYGAEVRKGRQEAWFNQFNPFYKTTVIYVVALLAGLFYWFTGAEWMRRSGFYLIGLAFVIHTIGLVLRMYLEKRPPVTNLYSSAVFIGWGSVLVGLFLERLNRDGIGTVVAATTGFVTQIIALNLAVGGDTMEMMRAVLDSNFWLATHVVVITLGYSAMFVAWLLAAIFVLRGFLTPSLGQEKSASLNRMVYGVMSFATLFSFVGTVLGGIWADQSWGRFWGWDPKENGALLIVIWCAVYLHARWGGLVRERGLMAIALVGGVITSWSWFGVNMLGVGLHSYGFMDSGFKWLALFGAINVALLIPCFLPVHIWRSGVARLSPSPA